MALALVTGVLGAGSAGTAHAVPPGPVITRFAGTAVSSSPTAPGPALDSNFYYPRGLAVDSHGNVYVGDCGRNVYEISPAGQMTVVAGNQNDGAPLNGPATSSPMDCPDGLAVDSNGTVYISQLSRHYIDEVRADGILTIIAGTGSIAQPTAGPATASSVPTPHGLALDTAGNLIVADHTTIGRVFEITPAGQLRFIAGNGTYGPPVQGPALQSPLGGVYGGTDGVTVDAAGNSYLADHYNDVVDRVTPAGQLSVFAGTPGLSGLPTPGRATASRLGSVTGLASDAAGNIYLADPTNHLIEKVTPGGTLSIVAGNGTAAAPTYGGPAVSSALDDPENLTAMADGTLIVADSSNYTVDRIGEPTPGAVGDFFRLHNGDTTGSVTFWAPQDTGDGPITGYEVSTDGGTTWHRAAASGTVGVTVQLTGLVNGRGYAVRVRAVNAAGPGPASPVITVTPRSFLALASAPTATTGRAGPTTASLRWQAPSDRGNPALTGYTVTLTDRGTGRVRVLHVGVVNYLAVAGLTPGEQYSFTVAAVNRAGTGPVARGAFTTSPPPFAVTAAQRRLEIAVPAHPRSYRGPLRHTRADGRSRDGMPAFAAGSLHGYRLHAGQAVSLGANLFAYNSGRLSARGRAAVRALVADLAGVRSVTCEGYTDYQVDPAHARLLSLERADALCNALGADGLRVQHVRAAGYGGQHPAVVGGTIHQRGANRRVILVTS